MKKEDYTKVNVFTQIIEGHRALVYRYNCNPDIGFRLHVLSEVGPAWQAEAKRKADLLAAKGKCRIEKVELREYPWFVEALVKTGRKV